MSPISLTVKRMNHVVTITIKKVFLRQRKLSIILR